MVLYLLKVPESKWRCKVSEKALGGEGGNQLAFRFLSQNLIFTCQEYCVKTDDAHWGQGQMELGTAKR